MSFPNYVYLAGGFFLLCRNILLNMINDVEKTLNEVEKKKEAYENMTSIIISQGQEIQEWFRKFFDFNIVDGDLQIPSSISSISKGYIMNIAKNFKGKKITKKELNEYVEDFGQLFIDKNEEIFECPLIHLSLISICWTYTAVHMVNPYEGVFNQLKKMLKFRHEKIKQVKLGELLLTFQKERCFEQKVYNSLLIRLESLSIFLLPYIKLVPYHNNVEVSNKLIEREFKGTLVGQDLKNNFNEEIPKSLILGIIRRGVNQWVIETPKKIRVELKENIILLKKGLVRYFRSLNDISFKNLVRDLPEGFRAQENWIIRMKKLLGDQIMDRNFDAIREIEKCEEIKKLIGKAQIYEISLEKYNKIFRINRLVLNRMVITCIIMYVNEVPKSWGMDLVIKFSKKSVIKIVENFTEKTIRNILVAYRILGKSLITKENFQSCIIYTIRSMEDSSWKTKVEYAWGRRKKLDQNTRPSPSGSPSSNSSQPSTNPSAQLPTNQGSGSGQTERASQTSTNQGSGSGQTERASQTSTNQGSGSEQTERASQTSINQGSQTEQTEKASQTSTNQDSRSAQIGELLHSTTSNSQNNQTEGHSRNSNNQNSQNTIRENNGSNRSNVSLIGILPYIANGMSDEFKSWYRQQSENNREFVRVIIDCVKNPAGIDNFVMANREFFEGSKHTQSFVKWGKTEGRLSKSGTVDGLVERLKGEGFSEDFKENFASKLRI